MQILLGALAYSGDRFKLVMTLRADFMAAGLDVPGLAQLLQEASVFVPPHLSDADYRRAIVRPAEAVGLDVEPELVEVVLQDLDRAAGDLPLLEFVLAQLWEYRQPGRLTLQVYQQDIGGLKGALERKAQAIYDSLDDEARACARWIFLSLTQLGEGTEDTSRRALKSDLIVAKYPEPLVDRTLQVLTAAKLVVVSAGDSEWQLGRQRSESPSDSDEAAGDIPPEPTVEVAHEALIRHWPTLRWWLEENRSRLRARRQIESAAQQWMQHDRQPDFLLQGVRLDAAAEVYAEAEDELSQDVQAFVEAGLAAREARARQLRRRLRRARWAISTISTLAIAAVGLGGIAVQQRQRAQLSEITALMQLSGGHLQSGRGLDAATAALRAGRQVQQLGPWGISAAQRQQAEWQAASALQQSLTFGRDRNRLNGHTQAVNAVTLSSDTQLLASGSDDTSVRVWQLDGTLLHQLDGHADRVTSVAFSPDGSQLASGDASGEIRVWDAETGQFLKTLRDRGPWITQLAFSPDGRQFAAAQRDREVVIWNVDSEDVEFELSGHDGWVTDVQFAPDGDTIATASDDGTAKLWSHDGRLLQTSPERHAGGISSVSFSLDGQTLAIASVDGAIALWQAKNDVWTEIVPEQGALTNALKFSADGTQLLTGGADRTLRIWNVDGALLAILQGHEDEIADVQIAGDAVVTASRDRTLRIWNVPELDADPTARGTLDMAFVPNAYDSTQLVSAEWDGSVDLWRVTEGKATLGIEIRDRSQPPIVAVSVSPEGETFALAGADGSLTVADTTKTGQSRSLAGRDSGTTHVAFAPNGKQLASASQDGSVKLWQPESGDPLATFDNATDSIASLTFAPNADLLAASSHDGNVYIWDVETGNLAATLPAASNAIAFSPNGQYLAIGQNDSAITLWRWAEGTVERMLNGHRDRVTSIQFSADGSTLLSGSADRTAKLWRVRDGSVLTTLAGHRGSVRTARFSPDETAIASASGVDGIKIWSLELDISIATSCREFGNYWRTNPHIAPRDRPLCFEP